MPYLPIIRFNNIPITDTISDIDGEVTILEDTPNEPLMNGSIDSIINYLTEDTPEVTAKLYINDVLMITSISNNGILPLTFAGGSIISVKITIQVSSGTITINTASLKILFTENIPAYQVIHNSNPLITNIDDEDGELILFEESVAYTPTKRLNIFSVINSDVDNPYLAFRIYVNNLLISTATNHIGNNTAHIIANGKFDPDIITPFIINIKVTAQVVSDIPTIASIENANIRILCIN